MIKEILLAIILGALLGFGVTGGYIAINKEKVSVNTDSIIPTPIIDSTNTDTVSVPSPTGTTDNSSNSDHQLKIESPQNETIISGSKTTIKGTTSPLSSLIITTPIKTYYANADNAGNFNINIEIESGVNLVQIDSIDAFDNQASSQLIITYSTAKI